MEWNGVVCSLHPSSLLLLCRCPAQVTELLSGREFNLNQFEDALGYFRPVPPFC